MPEPLTLTFTRSINASPEEAFRAFTHATALRDWLCHAAANSPHKGGYLFLHWNEGYSARGSYTVFDPPHKLAFTWDGSREPGVEAVDLTFEASGGGTLVTLAHTLPDRTPEWQPVVDVVQEEWPAALENLQSFLEDGIDLRVARRPRLGIWYDEFTSHKAEQLGLPVNEGILLEGTAENTGARAVGLVKDDVLVSLNGVKLVDSSSFDQALRGLKAGDKPLVEYYRAGQKLSTPLELGSFSIPELPASPAEFATRVREIYRQLNEKINYLMKDLSEEQADKRPAENEWSAKEIIGHYILMEREYQSWVANMLRDNGIEEDLQMRPNVNERIGALVARLVTMPALFAELALAQEESMVMLAALPEQFTQRRKHLYRRAAGWLLENVEGHFENEHAEQIKQTVAAAKS
jgi:uncharacterized protein YndB with AHSA1/START domain